MNRARRKSVGAILVVAVLIMGLYALMSVRHDSGRQYPAYSSFRPDPLGTKVFFETLKRIPGVAPERALDWAAFAESDLGQGDLVFALAGDIDARDREASAYWLELERKAKRGATVVLAIRGQEKWRWEMGPEFEGEENEVEDAESKEDSEEEIGEKEDEEEEEEREVVWLSDWLESSGARLGDLRDVEDLEIEGEAILVAEPVGFGLTQSMALRSGNFFELAEGREWDVVFEMRERAVLLASTRGEGRLLLLADSYPFSNEALLSDRASEFFDWLLAGVDRVYFLEKQLGVFHQDNLISMARKYGFDVGLYLFIATAVAFVWRSGFAPIPRMASSREEAAVGLFSMNEGLTRLFRRAVGRDAIAGVAFEQWLSSQRKETMAPEKKAKAKAILERYEQSRKTGADLQQFYKEMYQFSNYKGSK